MNNPDCLFCKIVEGVIPSYKIDENERHIAILDIFPSVRGQTLILPKNHYRSYVFDMGNEDYVALLGFTKEVAHRIDRGLGAMRTCMVMEGMEVDHAHIKLYPIHCITSALATETIDLNEYRGFISTLHGKRAADNELAQIADRLRNTQA